MVVQRIAKKAKKRCKKWRKKVPKRGQNILVTYKTSSGLKLGTLVWRERKTFRAGFVSRQTRTTPDNDDYEADAATDDDGDGDDDAGAGADADVN